MDMPFIGLISLFAFDYAPPDWTLCDGKLLNVSQYNALYALITNKFGGNTSQFAVPNLLGAEPIPNMHYYICLNGIWPQRP